MNRFALAHWRRDVGAAAVAIALGALALGPVLAPWMAVAGLRLALPGATRRAYEAPLPAPPGDPAAALAMLSRDPLVRAWGAVYRAARLRPLDPAAAVRALSFENGPDDPILRALHVAERLLAAPGVPAPSGDRSQAAELAIVNAARMTRVDAGFLRRTAARESGLNPYAVAGASSARGLFQFVDQTLLISVAKWGARHGLAREAAAIRFSPKGRAYVPDAGAQRAILMLRYQPDYAARLAAELTAENATLLSDALGRPPGPRELYAAHLLGPDAALRLIRAAEAQPRTPAALLFPGAAATNPQLFYRASAPRSVSELLLSFSQPP